VVVVVVVALAQVMDQIWEALVVVEVAPVALGLQLAVLA
jgi:hypothetical protein